MRKKIALVAFSFCSIILNVFAQNISTTKQDPIATKRETAPNSNQPKIPSQKKNSKTSKIQSMVASIPEIPEKPNLEEAIQLREELMLMKRDVEYKINQLQMMKKSYDESKNDVDQKLKDVDEQRKLLQETLQQEKTLKGQRLTSAVAIVSKMEPRKAAPIFESMDKDLVVILLAKLPQRVVTKLFENLSSEKATQYLEYYTRIRSGREFEMLRDFGLCGQALENDENTQKKETP